MKAYGAKAQSREDLRDAYALMSLSQVGAMSAVVDLLEQIEHDHRTQGVLLSLSMSVADMLARPPADLAPDFHEAHRERVAAGLQVRAAHNAMMAGLYRGIAG